MPIETLRELHSHFRLALQIELATIPPYLYAMYSIADQASEATLLIRSIVAEEMLHAALVSNVLVAVGGQPDFKNPDLFPRYPMFLPHHTPPLELGLQPCSKTLVQDVFMTLEQPEVHGAPDQPDEFETLGQFYHALEKGLEYLAARTDLFADPHVSNQLSNPAYYAPVQFDADDSGGLMLVHGLESALEAIEVIVHQGEGSSSERWADPDHRELTHYYKLRQISDGTIPIGEVRSLPLNPRTADYPTDLQPVSNLFNAAYTYLFQVLDDLYSPKEDKGAGVGDLYSLMTSVLSLVAHHLTMQPIGHTHMAGPTFELFEFRTDDPGAELSALAIGAATGFPELVYVADRVDEIVNGRRRLRV